ncbi:hypothetical protein DFQ26_007454 [Actinomortierella ambigua]|nr:hypothetical protein DFQ26_007454 [Actinomortierella ambigua]
MKSLIVSALLLVPAVVNAAEFYGCTDDQQRIIDKAAQQATFLVEASNLYVHALGEGTPRYTTWFGEYAEDRSDELTLRFEHLAENQFHLFLYDCSSCQNGESSPGYVDPSRFGDIRLCPSFWKEPLTGTDSQAGTLVGLASMFNINCGAKLVEQGQANCKRLATYDAYKAVGSAYNIQYFAENNPPQ